MFITKKSSNLRRKPIIIKRGTISVVEEVKIPINIEKPIDEIITTVEKPKRRTKRVVKEEVNNDENNNVE